MQSVSFPRLHVVSPRRFVRGRLCRVVTSPEVSVTIPPGLENSVAVLDLNQNDRTTKCYVLGISHVSKASCEQIVELIDAVKPDIVCVELSRDRVGLLVDRDKQDSQTWQARSISIVGSTFSEDWPSKKEFLDLIETKKGVPIQIEDIERDVLTLLSTGVFGSGKPTFTRADESEAPAFSALFRDGDLEVQPIPPLGSVDFEMRDRSLPPIINVVVRVDSSLKSYSLDQDYLDEIAAEALEQSKQGRVSLSCYLRLRKQILEHCASKGASEAVVVFTGEDRGDTEVVVRSRKPTDPVLVTGFEQGAEGGYGWGIAPFRPANRPVKLTEKMLIPSKSLQLLTGNDGEAKRDPADLASEKSLIKEIIERRPTWREWAENESQTLNTQSDERKKGIADYFGILVTSIYGKFQGDAGRKVGVDPGAAWRSAMKASVQNGVSIFQLFDIPEEISQKKIAESIFVGMGSRMAMTAAYIASVVTLARQDWCPDALSDKSALVALIGSVALLWPVFGPYAEIVWLASKSKEEIEDAVKVKEPIQSDLDTTLKLFGEDSLLSWPGAMEPIVHQRDKYMARNLFLAAQGLSNGAPAYVPDVQSEKVVCRLVMPEDGPERSAPLGIGDGSYSPTLNGTSRTSKERKIVAVVGSAHVRGMCKEWNRLLGGESPSIEEFLD